MCRVETIFSRTFYFNWILIFLCEKRVYVPCTPCTHRILYSVYHQNNRKNQDFSSPHLFKGGLRPPETLRLQGAKQGRETNGTLRPLRALWSVSRLLPVNLYSRRQAAVNQIISIPTGASPWDNRPIFLCLPASLTNTVARPKISFINNKREHPSRDALAVKRYSLSAVSMCSITSSTRH